MDESPIERVAGQDHEALVPHRRWWTESLIALDTIDQAHRLPVADQGPQEGIRRAGGRRLLHPLQRAEHALDGAAPLAVVLDYFVSGSRSQLYNLGQTSCANGVLHRAAADLGDVLPQ